MADLLLDTDAIIALALGDEWIGRYEIRDGRSCVSLVSFGELAETATPKLLGRESRRVWDVLERIPLLDFDVHVARTYGRLRSQLADSSRVMPRDNRVWVAAHAVRYELTVVSRYPEWEQLRTPMRRFATEATAAAPRDAIVFDAPTRSTLSSSD